MVNDEPSSGSARRPRRIPQDRNRPRRVVHRRARRVRLHHRRERLRQDDYLKDRLGAYEADRRRGAHRRKEHARYGRAGARAAFRLYPPGAHAALPLQRGRRRAHGAHPVREPARRGEARRPSHRVARHEADVNRALGGPPLHRAFRRPAAARADRARPHATARPARHGRADCKPRLRQSAARALAHEVALAGGHGRGYGDARPRPCAVLRRQGHRHGERPRHQRGNGGRGHHQRYAAADLRNERPCNRR